MLQSTSIIRAYHRGIHISFGVIDFPDGQRNLTCLGSGHRTPEDFECLKGYIKELKRDHKLDICRIEFKPESFRDFELLIAAVSTLRGTGFDRLELFMPYVLGARSDRQFTLNSTNYIKNVIAPLINALNFESVIVFEPHSDVIESTINNVVQLFGMEDILPDSTTPFRSLALLADIEPETSLFIAPDAGALKRVYKQVAELELSDSNRLLCASKLRDVVTGDIIRTELTIPDTIVFSELEHIVILDDICDGGWTFIQLAKVINERMDSYFNEREFLKRPKLVLYVAHGIFSKGIDALFNYFDIILTTDSRIFPTTSVRTAMSGYGQLNEIVDLRSEKRHDTTAMVAYQEYSVDKHLYIRQLNYFEDLEKIDLKLMDDSEYQTVCIINDDEDK